MSNVIIDSWGLAEVMRNAVEEFPNYQSSRYFHICRENLLTAIVLWDDIYADFESHTSLPPYETIIAQKLFRALKSPSFIHQIDIHDQFFIHDLFVQGFFDSELYAFLNNFIKRNKDSLNYTYQEEELVLRSVFYLLQANLIGATYLPHPLRAKALYDSGIFKREFDGCLYIDIINKEVREYIDAINELAQCQLLSTPFPVLYKFIAKLAKNPLDEFKVALDLRKDKNVSLFRKSVNDISEELKKGNIHALRASMMKTKEICDEISNSLYKKQVSYGVSLGLSPSIEISRDGTPKVSSGFHTTFLSELAEFALKGKIPARYSRRLL